MRTLKVVPVLSVLASTLCVAAPAGAVGEQVNLVVKRSNDEYTYSKITFEDGDLAVIVVKGSVNPWGWQIISNYYPPNLGAKKNHVRALYPGCLVAKHDGGAVNVGNFLAARNINGQLRFKFQGARPGAGGQARVYVLRIPQADLKTLGAKTLAVNSSNDEYTQTELKATPRDLVIVAATDRHFRLGSFTTGGAWGRVGGSISAARARVISLGSLLLKIGGNTFPTGDSWAVKGQSGPIKLKIHDTRYIARADARNPSLGM